MASVVALRDNKGRSLQTWPLEQLVIVHPRRIQQDTRPYHLIYDTSQNSINRLTLANIQLSQDLKRTNVQEFCENLNSLVQKSCCPVA